MAVCKLSINHFGYRSITLGGLLLLLSFLNAHETIAQDTAADQNDLPNRVVLEHEIGRSDETEPPAGFVEIQNLTFREDMALEGTGFGLHYSSRRVPGNLAVNQLNIPIFDAQNPPNYDSVNVAIHVAGRTLFHAESKPLQSPFHLFHWDGLDNQTNPVVGVERVKLNFVFKQTVYVMESSPIGAIQFFGSGGDGGDDRPPLMPYEGGSSGGSPSVGGGNSGQKDSPPNTGGGGSSASVEENVSIPVPKVMTYEKTQWSKIGTVMASIHRLGGWTISPHHHYDQSRGVLFMGSGSRRDVEPVGTPDCVFDAVGDPGGTNLVSVIAEDGSELFVFNAEGRHLLTLDTISGLTNFSFGYDSTNLLVAITDRHGNVTTIDRDGEGDPVAIISPFGLRTELMLNSSGYIEQLINPAYETNLFQYTSGGLLTNIVNRRGKDFAVTYCTTGLVRRVDFPDGFSWAFSRSEYYMSNRYEFVVGGLYTNVYHYEYLEGADIGVRL